MVRISSSSFEVEILNVLSAKPDCLGLLVNDSRLRGVTSDALQLLELGELTATGGWHEAPVTVSYHLIVSSQAARLYVLTEAE